jgi:branched-subunit amino acid ABC-type transport system permease component
MATLIGIGIVTGLGLGSMYALISAGYTLILASSGVFNFAQGSIVMAGALGAYGLSYEASLPFPLTCLAVIAGGAVAGVISELLAVHAVARSGHAGNLTEGTLVTTLGLGLAMNSAVALTFGLDTRPVPSYVSDSPIKLLGVPIRPVYLVMMGAVIVFAVVMETVLHRTRTGVVLRATVEDAEGASLNGISILKVVLRSFAVAGAIAALAGALVVPVTSASPFLADQIALLGFAGMAIGGYGSFSGALVGGMVVGLLTGLLPIWVDPHLSSVIVYLVMVGFLLLRPRGLFGSAGMFGAARLRDV